MRVTTHRISCLINTLVPGRITVKASSILTLCIRKMIMNSLAFILHSCTNSHNLIIICSIFPIFRYLNQQHIKKQKVSEAEILYGNGHLTVAQEQMEIGELGLDIWRIFMIQNLGGILVKQILHGIERDRLENRLTTKDIETIYGVISSFVMVQDYRKKGNLKLYENIFECKMLEASGEYFKSQASKLLQSCTVSQYMQEVIRILEEENIRSHKFMHVSSIQKLKKECEDRMITDHKTFLYSECKEMVSTDKRDDLKNLYTLLKPINDGLKELIQFLLEQIKNEGNESIINLKGENVRSLTIMIDMFINFSSFNFH